MNLEVALYLLSGSGVLIMLMLAIFGFFIKKYAESIENRFQDFNLNFDALNLNMQELITNITKQETQTLADKEACHNTHKEIAIKFNRLNIKVDKNAELSRHNEKKIAVIETKIENKQ